MGLLDRIGRVIRANLNSLVSKLEDPEKILDQALEDMREEQIQLRQAVAQAIATQKRTERQCAQAESSAQQWYDRAQLALQKGEEAMAREALIRRQSYLDTISPLKEQLGQQSEIVTQMKKNLNALERKISDARTKRDMYIARLRSAKASQQLNEMMGRAGNSSARAAFERMEEQILQMEAKSEAIAELEGNTIEQQFEALKSSDAIEDELQAMKARLSGETDSTQLPPG